MTTFPKIRLKSSLSNTKTWLFFSAANFALFYGILSHRMESRYSLITAFFWILALFILWKKRDEIAIFPKTIATVVGFLILGWLLFRSLSTFWFDHLFLQAVPLIGFFALASIASGWNKLNLYFKPFVALFLLGLADNLLARVFRSQLNISELTAQGSAFFLHYIGFDVLREGVFIHLNKGSVEVWYACTGGPLITLLLQLTLALMLVIPLSWNLLSKLIFGIFGLGFFLGIIRVALLAVVVSNEAAFDYWHGDEGNQIFSLIAFSINS